MQKNLMSLYYASPDFAQYYQYIDLTNDDTKRLQCAPNLSTRLDWQVSRALKARAGGESGLVGVLSHCQGYAVYLCHGAAVAMGVDLERLRPRHVAAWHDWIVHADEQCWLAQRGYQLIDYYALWCLKESLIKACNGQWADLAHVGLRKQSGHFFLYANQQFWLGDVWRLGTDFVLACAHQQVVRYQFHGFGQWQGVLPQPYLHFRLPEGQDLAFSLL